jgi:hypothetical protein
MPPKADAVLGLVNRFSGETDVGKMQGLVGVTFDIGLRWNFNWIVRQGAFRWYAGQCKL